MNLRVNLPALICIAALNTAFAASYRDIQDMYDPIAKLESYRYLHGTLKVTSRLPKVRPGDIQAVIHAHSGDIAVKANDDGAIAFPMNDALLKENPDVDFNQPKGTIEMRAAIEVSSTGVAQCSYDQLNAMVTEYERWQKERLSLFARIHVPQAKAWLIEFAKSTPGAANVMLPSGALQLQSDARHQIRIALNQEWQKLNPLITFNVTPARILMTTE